MRRSAAAIPTAATALAACLAGCAGAPTDAVATATPPVAMDVISPVVRGANDGLEVQWFIIDDEQNQLFDTLLPYAHQPFPIDEPTRADWAVNGMRLVRVPLDDLPGVIASLPTRGAPRREWLGWATDWREAFRGGRITDSFPIVLNRARARLEPGVLRLITRAWSAPADSGPVIRVELAAQLERTPGTRRDVLAPLWEQPTEDQLSAIAQGETLPRLALEAALEPGYAYLIVPCAPEAPWITDDAEQAGAYSGGLTPVSERAPDGPAQGPTALPPATIGEAMLTAYPDANMKAIVALTPRTPVRFRLLTQ